MGLWGKWHGFCAWPGMAGTLLQSATNRAKCMAQTLQAPAMPSRQQHPVPSATSASAIGACATSASAKLASAILAATSCSMSTFCSGSERAAMICSMSPSGDGSDRAVTIRFHVTSCSTSASGITLGDRDFHSGFSSRSRIFTRDFHQHQSSGFSSFFLKPAPEKK